MLLPAIILPKQEDRPDEEVTKITYLPHMDAFLIGQGVNVTPDPKSPTEGQVYLTLHQLGHLFGVLQNERFIDAMAMARNDYNRKALN
jgi:hypothetical protein